MNIVFWSRNFEILAKKQILWFISVTLPFEPDLHQISGNLMSNMTVPQMTLIHLFLMKSVRNSKHESVEWDLQKPD